MLSETRIRELFRDYLPPGVNMVTISAKDLTDQARRHPYIQLQIQMGVYTEDNLAEDFLSWARAHSDPPLQVISIEIFENLLEGIPDDIAENYVRHVAAHEAHHFHEEHSPVSAADHSVSELACAQQIASEHPELNEAVHYVEANSPVYRRVFARIDTIKNNLQGGIAS